MTGVTSIPTIYAGVEFRSTLEADWAATLDSLGIVWQYEPEAVRLPSGVSYRPDFYLPRIATWLEVKGPHMQRIRKTEELAETVFHFPDCSGRGEYIEGFGEGLCCRGEYQLVVVGLAPERGLITWQLLHEYSSDHYDHFLTRCPRCDEWWWMSCLGAFGCRAHRRFGSGDENLGGETGEDLPFVRASGVTR